MIRFILLSTYRSGTAFLRTMLIAHPRVNCLSEIYTLDYGFWDFETEEKDGKAFADCVRLHASDPVRFIETYGFRPKAGAGGAAGFQLMYDQPVTSRPELVWDWLAVNRDIRIIHLVRRDDLLRYVSFVRAQLTSEWVRLDPSVASPPPVHIDPEAFLANATEVARQRDAALSRLADHPLLSLAYEDLVANTERELHRVFDFLEVEPVPPQPGTVRQAGSDARASISNYEELRERLAGSHAAMAATPGPGGLTGDTMAQIRKALLETYFRGSWVEKEDSEAARRELLSHTHERFDICRRWLVPWIRRHIELGRANVVEIGCGTGSCTAAIAAKAAYVDAYEVAGGGVEAARRRFAIMGLNNVRVHEHTTDKLLDAMAQRHAAGTVDCVILYAVLERQKYHERLATLRCSWTLLRPGGILVVGETPNRLTWLDHHTSRLPFFNLLPDDVALDYASRSPRRDFRDAIAAARDLSDEEAFETLARWGRGVSYHEFEIALGDLEPLIVGDGFDPEPLSYFGVSLEARLLYTYAKRKPLPIPAAFLRETIEVILRKPGGSPEETIRGPARELDSIVQPLVELRWPVNLEQ
jgi:SAM-dependent methyltransferase